MVLTPLRHAVRSLAATPSITLLVIVTLAVGLGATTTIASIVDAVLLARLPFRDADRLVVVWEVNRDRPDGSHGVGRNVAGPGNFVRWRERATTLESMSFLAGGHGTLSIPVSRTATGAGEPARVPSAYVGGTFFQVVGASPVAGRLLRAQDAVEGAEPVVVVSERWALRQQRAPASLPGERIVIDGERITIVGVVDRAFDLPHGAEIWSPMSDARFAGARGRWMGVVARLVPTATREAAQQEMSAIAAALEAETPERNTGWGVNVQPLADELVTVVRPGLTAVALAALCVLAVACLNVANLLLARALARHRDAGIRLALGAQAHRLVSQAMLEGLVLALAGGALGLLLAAWGLGTYQMALQGLLGTAAPLAIDGRVLAAGLVLALVTGLLFSAFPAWLMARRVRVGGLGDGRIISAGRSTGSLRRALVVSEIALALVLSLGVGGLLRGYWTLSRIDPGFEAEQVLTARVAPAGPLYREDGTVGAYLTRLVGRIRAIGDVEHAGAISFRPLGLGAATSYQLTGRTVPVGQEPVADVRAITPGLLEALGVPHRAGRLFTDEDTAESVSVAVVNEAFVRDLPAGVDPIDLQVELSWGGTNPRTVVGVVADVRLRGLDAEPRPTVYLPLTQSPYSAVTIVVRGRGDVLSLAGALREAAAEIDPAVPMTDIEPLRVTVAASISRPRVLLGVLASLAGVALFLSLIGLYGVMAHTVQQRMREIGVRMAVGAAPGDVLRLLTAHGVRLIVAGCAAGAVLALLADGAITRLFGDVVPSDVFTFAAVVVAFMAVGLVATVVPAWRAARVDPLRVLRDD